MELHVKGRAANGSLPEVPALARPPRNSMMLSPSEVQAADRLFVCRRSSRSFSRGLGGLPFLLMLVLAIGCDGQSGPDSQALASLSPEEKFQRFMESFTALCRPEDQIAGRLADGPESGRGRVHVVFDPPTYQLHQPVRSGATHRAEVTVRMHSYFTSRAPLLTEEEESTEDPFAPGEPIDTDGPGEISPGREKKSEDTSPTARSDVFQRSYDLAYEAGRWVLKSRNVMPSMRLKFDRALEGQQAATQ